MKLSRIQRIRALFSVFVLLLGGYGQTVKASEPAMPLRNFRGIIVSSPQNLTKKELASLYFLAKKNNHRVEPVSKKSKNKKQFLVIAKTPSENIITPSLCLDIYELIKNPSLKCEPNWELLAAQVAGSQEAKSTPVPESAFNTPKNRHLKNDDIEALGGGQVAAERCALLPLSQEGRNASLKNLNAPKNKFLSGFWAQELVGLDLANAFTKKMSREGPSLAEVTVDIMDTSQNVHGDSVWDLLNSPEMGACAGVNCRKSKDSGLDSRPKYFDLNSPKGRDLSVYNEKILTAIDTLASQSPKNPVLNISMTGLGKITTDEVADYAKASNSVVVFASGNTQFGDPAEALDFYKHQRGKDFLIVGSLNPTGLVSVFSVQGPEVVVTAPSDHFLIAGGRPFSGTSGAAPLVTGTVAQIRAFLPELPLAEIKKLLQYTALPTINKFFDKPPQHGAGTLNSYGAVTSAAWVADQCKNLKQGSDELKTCHKVNIDKLKSRPQKINTELVAKTHRAFGCDRPSEERAEYIAKQKTKCEDKQDLVKSLRAEALLNPSVQKNWELLSCVYEIAAFPENAALYASLAQNTDARLSRNEHQKRWAESLGKRLVAEKNSDRDKNLVAVQLAHLGPVGRGKILTAAKDGQSDFLLPALRNMGPYRDPRVQDKIWELLNRAVESIDQENYLPLELFSEIFRRNLGGESYEYSDKFEKLLKKKQKKAYESIKWKKTDEIDFFLLKGMDLNKRAQYGRIYLENSHLTDDGWLEIFSVLSPADQLKLKDAFEFKERLLSESLTNPNNSTYEYLQSHKAHWLFKDPTVAKDRVQAVESFIEAMKVPIEIEPSIFMKLVNDQFQNQEEKLNAEIEAMSLMIKVDDSLAKKTILDLLLKNPTEQFLKTAVSDQQWNLQPELVEKFLLRNPDFQAEQIFNNLKDRGSLGVGELHPQALVEIARTLAASRIKLSEDLLDQMELRASRSIHDSVLVTEFFRLTQPERYLKINKKNLEAYRGSFAIGPYLGIPIDLSNLQKIGESFSPVEKALIKQSSKQNLLNQLREIESKDPTGQSVTGADKVQTLVAFDPKDKDFQKAWEDFASKRMQQKFSVISQHTKLVAKILEFGPEWTKAFAESVSQDQGMRTLGFEKYAPPDQLWKSNYRDRDVTRVLSAFEPIGPIKNPPTWVKKMAKERLKELDNVNAYLFYITHGDADGGKKTEGERLAEAAKEFSDTSLLLEAKQRYMGGDIGQDLRILSGPAKGVLRGLSKETLGRVRDWASKNSDEAAKINWQLNLDSHELKLALHGGGRRSWDIVELEKRVIRELKEAGLLKD